VAVKKRRWYLLTRGAVKGGVRGLVEKGNSRGVRKMGARQEVAGHARNHESPEENAPEKNQPCHKRGVPPKGRRV